MVCSRAAGPARSSTRPAVKKVEKVEIVEKVEKVGVVVHSTLRLLLLVIVTIYTSICIYSIYTYIAIPAILILIEYKYYNSSFIQAPTHSHCCRYVVVIGIYVCTFGTSARYSTNVYFKYF